jgi:cytochrome P450
MLLFLQSAMADPFSVYRGKPGIYFDEEDKAWGVFSYEHCVTLLQHPGLLIPAVQTDGLSEKACLLVRSLARLSNNAVAHADARAAAMSLMNKIGSPPISALMAQLLPDWGELAKKLPALALLHAFKDAAVIQERVPDLVKLMLPVKTAEQLALINEAVDVVYPLLEKQLATGTHPGSDVLVIANMIGLLIQSYDAGRGLLSNAVLHWQQDPPSSAFPRTSFITEVLRYAPPVHHTRRIAAEDILIDDHLIKANDTVILMLAAANRDASIFTAPDNFDLKRPNNDKHLTFGAGGHTCIAKHFITQLAANAMAYLDEQHPAWHLPPQTINYEPLTNVRLPQHINIIL